MPPRQSKRMTATMLSIIVPVYNAEKTLKRLLDSIYNQTSKGFELILVDDASTDASSEIAKSYPCTLIRIEKNRGPAFCRNLGAKNASGDLLLFTDSDCRVRKDWTEKIHNSLFCKDTAAIMGKLVLLPSNYIGDSISALGFPAGGSIGFEKIWKVDSDGFTNSLSSCNCAIQKNIFEQIGGFDESFPYAGGEDSFFAYNLIRQGYRILYCPDIVVFHEARDSLRSFIQWQYKRGISSYLFSTKISQKSRYLSLRLWSSRNILKTYSTDKKLPLILLLLSASFLIQISGFTMAKYMRNG